MLHYSILYVHVHVHIKFVFTFSFSFYIVPPLSLSLSLSLLYQLSLNNDVLNFYHHDTSVRLSAVKSLKSAITDGRGTSSPIHSYDDNFFSSVLLSRLTDDEPAVVKAVLDMGEEVSH